MSIKKLVLASLATGDMFEVRAIKSASNSFKWRTANASVTFLDLFEAAEFLVVGYISELD